MTTHLWEADHPYYCTHGNYYTRPGENHYDYENWAEFVADDLDTDADRQLLFRWDWVPVSGLLKLFFVNQRRAANWSVSVWVTEEDEDAVREYLKPRAEKMKKLWEPIL